MNDSIERDANVEQPDDDAKVSRRNFLEQTATIGGARVIAAATSACAAAQDKQASSSPQQTTTTGNQKSAVAQAALLTGTMLEYKSSDGKMIPAYLSLPVRNSPAPAVLVIHEVFGLNDHIKSIADRLAREGLVALAPNLFVRAPQPPPKDAKDIDALRRAVSSIPNDVAIKDMQAGLDYLKTRKEVRPRFGSVGFCMGGGFSYQLATHTKDLAGAVIFYGRTPVDLATQVSCPLLGNFGALDQGIPPETLKELQAALQTAGKTADIKIYPNAKHGFFNDTRPEAYNAEAAADAWQRTLRFFNERLEANKA